LPIEIKKDVLPFVGSMSFFVVAVQESGLQQIDVSTSASILLL
jgi:hypothetical protein